MSLIQFMCYLRPSELLSLRVGQVVSPVKGAGTKHWALLLAPEEECMSSKTQQFDESVLMDWPELPGLRGRPKEEMLWARSQKEYSTAFAKWAEVSGVHVLAAHPYSARHGGASWDALLKRRSLQEIQARGRWRAEQSVRRYEKHARLLKETEKLPAATRKYGSKIGEILSDVLARKVQKVPAMGACVVQARQQCSRSIAGIPGVGAGGLILRGVTASSMTGTMERPAATKTAAIRG